MKPALLLSVAAFVLPFEAAASELVPIQWTPDDRFTMELTVPAARFVEVCGQLPAKSRVTWAFEADAALNFNVHFHEGKEVRYPTRQDGTAKASGNLDVPTKQDYCWMWTNKSPGDATLKLELKRSSEER
jgi:hypothetical protein